MSQAKGLLKSTFPLIILTTQRNPWIKEYPTVSPLATTRNLQSLGLGLGLGEKKTIFRLKEKKEELTLKPSCL